MQDDTADATVQNLNRIGFGCLLLLALLLVAWAIGAFALWCATFIRGFTDFEGTVIVLLSLIFSWQLVGPWIRKAISQKNQSSND